ncbi:hypothetical protein CBR_g34302 [Chara braunii]|uniref:DDE Tnp4 domain-containing protein n=1 Tax=Chara braunii TaxID=69332 RepID=A0A388JYP3_CHABU|nr:hypothetical protein CBR_g34302 [Chara braunii]|eukprot:GBG62931.1 hypothetical protein CBR_g34302 [Chara braunii]
MSPRIFREIVENLTPILERRVTFYRESLQPDHIVAYGLYRWASGETYESSTCSFGIGRASGLVAVRDVTAALLSVYREKVAWPTGVRKAVVLRAFADKGFPELSWVHRLHPYLHRQAGERGSRRLLQPQETILCRRSSCGGFGLARPRCVCGLSGELPRREGHPSVQSLVACGGGRVVHRASCVAVVPSADQWLSAGRQWLPANEWMVVPYGGTAQTPFEARFDNKQKTARGAVERAFGRLKGMWRLFLGSHKTNMETLPQQFVAVCILHNILIDAGIPFDENLLWEVDANGVRRRVDLAIQRPPKPLCMETSMGEAVMLREALAERMMQR